MVTDKTIRVTYDGGQTLDITITGEQLIQTARRRMNTLMPKARVTDFSEVHAEATQLDATTARKR